MSIYQCVHICTYIHTWIHPCIHICTHTDTYTYACACVYVCVFGRSCECVCAYVCVRACVRACVCVCAHGITFLRTPPLAACMGTFRVFLHDTLTATPFSHGLFLLLCHKANIFPPRESSDARARYEERTSLRKLYVAIDSNPSFRPPENRLWKTWTKENNNRCIKIKKHPHSRRSIWKHRSIRRNNCVPHFGDLFLITAGRVHISWKNKYVTPFPLFQLNICNPNSWPPADGSMETMVNTGML